MKKDEAERLAKRLFKNKLTLPDPDELVIEEGGPSGFLGSIGDGHLHFRICKNMEAREKLLEQINIRMAATNHTIVWKLKYALDKAEFARTHVLTEDLEKVRKFLRDADRLTRAAIADFQRDADAYNTLADVAKQIKKSEAKE